MPLIRKVLSPNIQRAVHVSKREKGESSDRALEVGLGVVDVVGALEKDGGDAEAGLDLDDGEE